MYLLACTMPEARKRNSFMKGAIAPFTITIILCDNGRASKGVEQMSLLLVGSYVIQHDRFKSHSRCSDFSFFIHYNNICKNEKYNFLNIASKKIT